MDTLIRVNNLRFQYPDETELMFDGQELTVAKGERVAILGPNGSGKSTLLSLLLGLLTSTEGEVDVLGINPGNEFEKVRARIGALLQNVELQIIAPRVWDDISFSPRNYGYDEEETNKLVEKLLVKLDIEHLRDKVPHYLSGGEKTKVALAGALATKPELLILDEPFEHIDPVCRKEMIDLLNRINREQGTAIILSTHNMNTVPLIADTVYLIAAGGRIVKKGSPIEIFSDVESLSKCHIEAPILGKLFSELKKSGIDLDVSLTVEEAASTLKDMLLLSKNRSQTG